MYCRVPQDIERVKLPGQNEELLPFSWKDQAYMYRENFISKGIKIGFTVSDFPRFHFRAICPFFSLPVKAIKCTHSLKRIEFYGIQETLKFCPLVEYFLIFQNTDLTTDF